MVETITIIAISSSFTLLLVLYQTISPFVKKKMRMKELAKNIDVGDLDCYGKMLEHRSTILPIKNIRVAIYNESPYSIKVRCDIATSEGKQSFGGLSDVTRPQLQRTYEMEPQDEAHCFIGRWVPKIRSGKYDDYSIGPPGNIPRCAPPSSEVNHWVEFIEHIPPDVHAENWTAKEGASLQISNGSFVDVVITTTHGLELCRRRFSGEEIVINCHNSGWTRSARESFGHTGNVARSEADKILNHAVE